MLPFFAFCVSRDSSDLSAITVTAVAVSKFMSSSSAQVN
jgi:hypothetical protein